jgi:hypothetical protein
LNHYTLDTLDHEYGEFTVKERDGHFDIDDRYSDEKIRYSISRDALKAIRPKRWTFDIYWHEDGVECLAAIGAAYNRNSPLIVAKRFPAEQLAELHAIIQAIEYERSPTSAI